MDRPSRHDRRESPDKTKTWIGVTRADVRFQSPHKIPHSGLWCSRCRGYDRLGSGAQKTRANAFRRYESSLPPAYGNADARNALQEAWTRAKSESDVA